MREPLNGSSKGGTRKNRNRCFTRSSRASKKPKKRSRPYGKVSNKAGHYPAWLARPRTGGGAGIRRARPLYPSGSRLKPPPGRYGFSLGDQPFNRHQEAVKIKRLFGGGVGAGINRFARDMRAKSRDNQHRRLVKRMVVAHPLHELDA